MSGPTILVVEDNSLTRKMLRLTLETEGYVVTEAADGHTALAEAEREMPALILQDLVLPDMSGFELVRQLRGLAGGSAVPILALSGFSSAEDAGNLESGFTAFLLKPIEPGRLCSIIHSHAPLQSARRPSGDGRRVLVVDDDPIQLKLTCLHLQLLGFEVTPISTTLEALRVARAEPPDAIFSDVLMPDLDGFQLCLEMRKEPKLLGVPVVLASAWYETEAARELARRVGATALLRKTPDLGNVAQALASAMRTGPPCSSEAPNVEVRLLHAQTVIRQLEQQVKATTHLARRCTLQATQISLLSGVADALAFNVDAAVALGDILAATLDAAGISKGILYLMNPRGGLTMRHALGFAHSEKPGLDDFFGQLSTLEEAVRARSTVIIPSTILRRAVETRILHGAGASSAQLVPLTCEGHGVGALVLLATATDVTSDDAIAFARAMGNQLAQSLELASYFARLTASERRYRAVTEAAHDAISILKPDGVIVEVNPSFEATLGVQRELLIGHYIQEFTAMGHEREQQHVFDAPSDLMSDRGSPLPLTRADGTVAFMEFSNKAVEIGGEELVVAIGRDVTERVKTQAQLMFSDRMATIGSLAAGLAHEINNPLTATLANLEFALQELAAANASAGAPACLASLETLLREANEGAERVATIVRDLKIFSRAEEDLRGPVDVVRVLESALRMARNELRHRAELVRQYGDVPLVEANESRLGQVFLNLLINAAQALPEGHASQNQIVLRTRKEAAGVVAVEVEDSGAGIPPEHLRRLFTPFFTTKARGVGTGLGLSICKRIVTSFGGDITVESTVGKGTVFRVLLRAAPVAPSVRTEPTVALAGTPRRGQILIVDDDDMTARAVWRMLSTEHEVSMLQDATQALRRIFEGERFDVIICDLMMPDKTGPEFFEELSARAPEHADRVIFVTGGAFTVSARDFLDRVPNPCLSKPFQAQALRALINARLA